MDNWTVPIPESRLVHFDRVMYKITNKALREFNINPKHGSTIIKDCDLMRFLGLCETIPAVPAEIKNENTRRI